MLERLFCYLAKRMRFRSNRIQQNKETQAARKNVNVKLRICKSDKSKMQKEKR